MNDGSMGFSQSEGVTIFLHMMLHMPGMVADTVKETQGYQHLRGVMHCPVYDEPILVTSKYDKLDNGDTETRVELQEVFSKGMEWGLYSQRQECWTSWSGGFPVRFHNIVLMAVPDSSQEYSEEEELAWRDLE